MWSFDHGYIPYKRGGVKTNTAEKYIATLVFKNRIYQYEGQQFEDFFVDIMQKADSRFQPVKAYGNIGDRKNDGFIKEDGVYYQIFAPEEITKEKTIYDAVKKLEEDFSKLFAYWNEISPIKEYYDETKIHDVLEGANVNIYCYWNNFEQYSPDFSYQVAGCFVGFFIYKMGIEKSQLLMRNQEYKAARKVYRKQLDDIISQFESLTK